MTAVSAAHRISEQAAEYRAKPSAAPRQFSAHPESGQSDIWGNIMTALRSKKPGLASALAHSKPVEISDNQMVIGVQGNSFQLELVEKRESRRMIEEVASELLKKEMSIKIQPRAATPQPGIKTGQKKAKPEEQDPAVQDVLNIFTQGEVIEQNHFPE